MTADRRLALDAGDVPRVYRLRVYGPAGDVLEEGANYLLPSEVPATTARLKSIACQTYGAQCTVEVYPA